MKLTDEQISEIERQAYDRPSDGHRVGWAIRKALRIAEQNAAGQAHIGGENRSTLESARKGSAAIAPSVDPVTPAPAAPSLRDLRGMASLNGKTSEEIVAASRTEWNAPVAPIKAIERVLADAMTLYPGSIETPDYAVEVALWIRDVDAAPAAPEMGRPDTVGGMSAIPPTKSVVEGCDSAIVSQTGSIPVRPSAAPDMPPEPVIYSGAYHLDDGYYIKADDFIAWSAYAIAMRDRVDAAQAKIDALMLEYCPNEMSETQLDEWKRNQRPATPQETEAINRALAGADLWKEN